MDLMLYYNTLLLKTYEIMVIKKEIRFSCNLFMVKY